MNQFRANLRQCVQSVLEDHEPLQVTRNSGDFAVIGAEDWRREQETLSVCCSSSSARWIGSWGAARHLPTAVKKTVDQAADNGALEPLDVEVLRVLFLIRYLDTNYPKPMVDNLVTLCLDRVDADRLALKRRIEESLPRLEQQTLINRNGDYYFSLTNEEQDVGREIKTVDITSSEEAQGSIPGILYQTQEAEDRFEEALSAAEAVRHDDPGQPKVPVQPSRPVKKIAPKDYANADDGKPHGAAHGRRGKQEFMIEQLEVFGDVVSRLDEVGIPYMVSGSMAMNYYARPRMTRDIDLVVEVQRESILRLQKALGDDYYFSADAALAAAARRTMFNLIHLAHMVKVDCIIRKDSEYRKVEFVRRRKVEVGGLTFYIVAPEDLVLSKLEWAKESHSELQLGDVRNILESMPDLDLGYLSEWAARLGLSELLAEVTR